jgi:hypothetical protein
MSSIQIPAGLVQDTQDHTIHSLAACFNSDPFLRFLVCDFLQAPDDDFSLSLNTTAFGEFVPKLVFDGAVPVTVPGSGIASLWLVSFTIAN